MSSILLSIKPEYAKLIFEEIKLFEYRKRLTTKNIDRIIFYVTQPIMKVIGEVSVTGVVSGTPNAVWKQTKKNAGISREKYQIYFKGCEAAYAYKLEQPIIYDVPKILYDLGISQPPRSFIYLGDEI
jgi:predicted transcriptional regulator